MSKSKKNKPDEWEVRITEEDRYNGQIFYDGYSGVISRNGHAVDGVGGRTREEVVEAARKFVRRWREREAAKANAEVVKL